MLIWHVITVTGQTANPNYDADLALELGGDDYGMKSYILVILKTGTKPSDDIDFVRTAFRGHLDNIGRLVETGQLIVAGPLEKNEQTYRGIFILNVPTVDYSKRIPP
jgi:hypothetical protein